MWVTNIEFIYLFMWVNLSSLPYKTYLKEMYKDYQNAKIKLNLQRDIFNCTQPQKKSLVVLNNRVHEFLGIPLKITSFFK